jgi:hypothetical protein
MEFSSQSLLPESQSTAVSTAAGTRASALTTATADSSGLGGLATLGATAAAAGANFAPAAEANADAAADGGDRAVAARGTVAAAALLQELRALDSGGVRLAPYDERRVRDAIAGVEDACAELRALRSNAHVDPNDPFFAALPALLRAAAVRGRRAVAAYQLRRLRALTGLWWDAAEEKALPLCTAAERQFLEAYAQLGVDYAASFSPAVDLRAYLTRPPSQPPNNTVRVRAVHDTAFVSSATGETVLLYPGKQLLLPFDEAEGLLQRGAAVLLA